MYSAPPKIAIPDSDDFPLPQGGGENRRRLGFETFFIVKSLSEHQRAIAVVIFFRAIVSPLKKAWIVIHPLSTSSPV